MKPRILREKTSLCKGAAKEKNPTRPQTNKLFVIRNSLHDDPRNPGAFWHLPHGTGRLRFWSQFLLSSKLHHSFSDNFYVISSTASVSEQDFLPERKLLK